MHLLLAESLFADVFRTNFLFINYLSDFTLVMVKIMEITRQAYLINFNIMCIQNTNKKLVSDYTYFPCHESKGTQDINNESRSKTRSTSITTSINFQALFT